jgi:signal transduction histidine kinase
MICIEIVTVVGLVDYATGYETFFFVFYLAAVFLAVWFVSAAFGVLMSALSVAAWISANIAAGEHYSSYFIPVWNALIMFAFYLVVVWLLAELRTFQKRLEERVRQRTAALTKEIQERARLQKELLEATESAQRRIGYDLHDGLCQHLTGTALATQVLAQKLADQSLPATAEANRVVELVEKAIELTRSLARGLDPIEVQTGQLADSFRELAARKSERFKVSCQFQCPQAVPLHDVAVATQLYRIAQEAVTNAARHGQARHIAIRLDHVDNKIVLAVTDDGTGLPDDAGRGDGMGLRIMAYRAGMIGATFHIERLSSLSGTRVTCALALKEKN